MELLETTVSNWQNQVLHSIEDQLKAERPSPGPLAEIEFRGERNASFVTLLEQLKQPEVTNMLDVLRAAHNPVGDNFDMAKTELKKYSIEARENVRFLSTLVWIISRHYNKVQL